MMYASKNKVGTAVVIFIQQLDEKKKTQNFQT